MQFLKPRLFSKGLKIQVNTITPKRPMSFTKKLMEKDELQKDEFIKPIFHKNKYANPWSTYEDRGLVDVFKWVTNRPKRVFLTQEQLDKQIPIVKPDLDLLSKPVADDVQYTWIGHATVLVQMGGVNFITDPVFSDRCSPISFIGPKRYRRVPLEIEQLPALDFVVLSHNHYDHLDKASVLRIGNKPTWFVPLGLKSWFASIGITNVVELDWWQEHQFNDNTKVVLFPVQHWSNRGINRFESLWGGYGVITPQHRVFFSGDTGYCDVFKTIGKHYGPFDLSLIAIGAYCPRDFMRPQHINPEEAVQIHVDIKSKKSLGIHWGTFILTDEPEDEPPKLLKEEAAKKALGIHDFVVTRIGETRIVGKETSHCKDGELEVLDVK